jgi:hypothetical protein
MNIAICSWCAAIDHRVCDSPPKATELTWHLASSSLGAPSCTHHLAPRWQYVTSTSSLCLLGAWFTPSVVFPKIKTSHPLQPCGIIVSGVMSVQDRYICRCYNCFRRDVMSFAFRLDCVFSLSPFVHFTGQPKRWSSPSVKDNSCSATQ